ncbi:MAG: ATP-binding protein [Dehalococcoidia bacterium]
MQWKNHSPGASAAQDIPEGVAASGDLDLPAPTSLQETGLSPLFLMELALKVIHYGSPTAKRIAHILGLPPPLAKQLLVELEERRLCEVTGAVEVVTGNYYYRLTEKGRERLQEALGRNRYAGAVPVTLDHYIAVMQKVLRRRPAADAATVDRALSHLVLHSEVAESLKRALVSGRHAMLFGPSGNGKTEILLSFAQHSGGTMLVPQAIYSHGQVIRVFDPAIHVPVSTEANPPYPEAVVAESEAPLLKSTQDNHDRRWIRVKTPAVMAGGELGEDDLELTWDSWARFSQAPIHLKVQGGILIIDDFGRQKIRPEEVFNRWIMPLERGWDYLTLHTGEKIAVPFAVTLLFSTNLEPRELVHEAFLRRLPYKVPIPSPSPEEFREIVCRQCAEMNVEYTEYAIDYAVEKVYHGDGGEPRGCLPRDLITIIVENAHYDGIRPALTQESLDLAWHLYFLDGFPNPTHSHRADAPW